VASILRNTCWKAIRTYDANKLRAVPMEKPMGIEPLIDPARWAAAQKILDGKTTEWRARKHQDKAVALGLGLLRCHCGRFHYLRRDYRPGQHDLFYCGSNYKSSRYRGNSCGSASIRRVDADAQILEAITTMANVKTVRALVQQALQKPSVKSQPAARTQREIARVTAERERLIDLRMKDKITEEQFDVRDRKVAAELRDLEALLPKAEPAVDPKVMASAIASLFAEFPFMSPEEQYALARRVFVAFDVNEDGGVETAVIRGETLAQAYAKNGRPSKPPECRVREPPSVRRHECPADPL
jgi:hypothetical protein